MVNIYNSLYQKKIKENQINNFNTSISLNSFENEEENDETDFLNLDSESILELKTIFFATYKKLKIIKKEKNYISDRLSKLY